MGYAKSVAEKVKNNEISRYEAYMRFTGEYGTEPIFVSIFEDVLGNEFITNQNNDTPKKYYKMDFVVDLVKSHIGFTVCEKIFNAIVEEKNFRNWMKYIGNPKDAPSNLPSDEMPSKNTCRRILNQLCCANEISSDDKDTVISFFYES